MQKNLWISKELDIKENAKKHLKYLLNVFICYRRVEFIHFCKDSFMPIMFYFSLF